MNRNPTLGLALTLCTAVLWGVLPIVLKQLVERLDPLTVTWFRFLVSMGLLGLWLGLRRGLPEPGRLRRRVVLLLAIASAGLIGNYVGYLLSLRHITPGSAQMLIQ